MKYLILLLLPLLFIKCNSSDNEPCEWKENKFYASVDSVEYKGFNESGDSLFTIWVQFTAGSLSSELQDLGKLRDIEFTPEKIKSNQSKLGSTYTGIINDVVKGNCESPIISFDQKRR